MNPITTEVIGIVATLFILLSMLFKTNTLNEDIRMRVFNLIGVIVFAVYGCLIPAYSTIILNICLIIVNTFHLVILLKQKKKETGLFWKK